MNKVIFYVNDKEYTDRAEAEAAGREAGLLHIEWSKVDATGLVVAQGGHCLDVVAQGGHCLDDECPCEKWWTHWREARP